MEEKGPPSLTTCLAEFGAAGVKLARFGLVGLLRSIPGLSAAVLAGVVIMLFAWCCERQARRRDALQAQQVKKQAAADISQLQQQAAGALRDAKQSAEAVRALEARQQQLVREAEGLRQSLESLRQQELARTDEVATLPTSEVATRVAARLGEQVTGNREQVTGQQALNPLTRPALADENASAGHPLPLGGEGRTYAGVEGQSNTAAVSGQKPPGAETQGLASNASGDSGAALMLSDQGARKVETALIELDSCRQQAQLMGQQVSNCEQQSKLGFALRDQQASALAKLNAALADKDKILAESEAAHRAELKAARGSFRAHLIRAAEYFAGGFIAGVLVR